MRPELAASDAADAAPARDDTVNPRLPHGGVNDHMLLRLSASLQLTQLLLLHGGNQRVSTEATDFDASRVTPSSSLDAMDVDGERASAHDDEAAELWVCWKQLRNAAALSAEVRARLTYGEGGGVWLS